MSGSFARLAAAAACTLLLLSLFPLSAAAAGTADMLFGLSGSSTVYTDGYISYGATIGNRGPDAATNVVVSGALPAGTTFVASESDPRCGSSGGTITCNLGGPFGVNAIGEFRLLTLQAPSQPTTVTLTMTLSSDQTDPNPSDNTGTQTTTVQQRPVTDVAAIASAPANAFAYDSTTVTAGVAVNGPESATNTQLTATLSGHGTFDQWSLDPHCYVTTTAATQIKCYAGTLAPGQSWQIDARVNTTSTGTMTDSVAVYSDPSDPNPANNTAVSQTEIQPQAVDMALTGVQASRATAHVGDDLAYYVNVSNQSRFYASGVTVTAQLSGPASYNVAGSNPNCTVTGATMICRLGAMFAYSSSAAAIVVKADDVGIIALAATVTADEPDPDPANNNGSATTQVSPAADVVVTSTDTEPVKAGKPVVYTVSVANSGPSAATQLVLHDSWTPAPVGASFKKVSWTQGSCWQDSATSITCSLGRLAPGGVATVTLELVSGRPGILYDTASAAAAEFDPNDSNNTFTQATTVIAS